MKASTFLVTPLVAIASAKFLRGDLGTRADSEELVPRHNTGAEHEHEQQQKQKQYPTNWALSAQPTKPAAAHTPVGGAGAGLLAVPTLHATPAAAAAAAHTVAAAHTAAGGAAYHAPTGTPKHGSSSSYYGYGSDGVYHSNNNPGTGGSTGGSSGGSSSSSSSHSSSSYGSGGTSYGSGGTSSHDSSQNSHYQQQQPHPHSTAAADSPKATAAGSSSGPSGSSSYIAHEPHKPEPHSKQPDAAHHKPTGGAAAPAPAAPTGGVGGSKHVASGTGRPAPTSTPATVKPGTSGARSAMASARAGLVAVAGVAAGFVLFL